MGNQDTKPKPNSSQRSGNIHSDPTLPLRPIRTSALSSAPPESSTHNPNSIDAIRRARLYQRQPQLFSTLGQGAPEAPSQDSTPAPVIKPSPAVEVCAEMANEEIATKLENLDLKGQKEINILLLGETGAGKSTFINSIFNYLQFGEFQKAEKEHLNVLIPAKFSILNHEGDLETVEIGSREDNNEDLTTGASATQGVKTYSFHIKGGQTLIRLIDTPGMADTRGIEFDDQNCENILNYLNRLHHLHAICYLNKPNQSRNTVTFAYCVTQILSRLEKSACKNIVFIFTHAKGSNYSPGETFRLLKGVVEDIKKNPAHAEIPLDDNAFCFDNEAFMALAAIRQGVKLSPDVRKWSIESWNKSNAQCWKMISYILDLKPHMVHNTTAVNEARRVIYQLAQPMADIAQLVNDNIQILEAHQRHLDIDNRSLVELKKKLFIPVIELVVKPLNKPATVCADLACSEVYDVGEKKESHYKRCHDPCYLTNVPRDHLGSPELMSCAAMGPNQLCIQCTHSYKVHMHIYYTTEKKHTQKIDDIVSKNINTKELVIENAQKVIAEVKQRKQKLESELKTIVKCNAKFAHFLSNNAIAPFNDSYAEYINYQMIRERRLGGDSDLAKLAGLQRLLREHSETKKVFAEAAEMQKKLGRADQVTPEDISQSMQELFHLSVNGTKIKELFNSQKKSLRQEYTFSEYKHEGAFQQATPSKKKEKEDGAKGSSSSASNPTTKFQRGRPNNRGNFNNQQRGRGRPTGQYQRNEPSDRTPPPPYHEVTNPLRYPPPSGHPPPNYPPDYRGQGYPPDHQGRPYPPHPDRHPQHPPPLMSQRPHSLGGSKPDDKPSTIQVNVTLPPPPAGGATNPPRDPPPSDYYQRDRQDYPPRDPYGNYPPRPEYPPREGYPPRDPYAPREGYPARDPYPPRDPYSPRDPYPPRDPYSPRDPYPPRDPYTPRDQYPPRDSYPPRDHYPPRDPYYPPHDPYQPRPAYPPREGYPYDPRYPEQGSSSSQSPPHAPRGRGYNNNRGQNNPRGNNNYRGNRGNRGNRGGINRTRHRKNKQDGNNANNSDEDSDTSVASSAK